MAFRDEEPTPLVHLSADFVRAKEYLEAIVTSTADAICTTDISGRIIYFSPGAERMLGVPAPEAMGQPAHAYYAGGVQEARAIMNVLRREGSIANREMALRTRDGRAIHVSMSASLLRDRNGKVIGTLGISKDITERIELERRLRELTITDNLTGLHNQRHLEERLAQEASRARRQRYKLSVIVIDLDGFKQVNDLRGHLEGDRILKSFSAVVQDKIRKGVDCAFRYGGDEFVLLLPGLAKARAARVAERLVAAARADASLHGLDFSWGVATLGRSESLNDFIRSADRRMFRMKSAKKKAAGASPASLRRLAEGLARNRPLALIWNRASSSHAASLGPSALV